MRQWWPFLPTQPSQVCPSHPAEVIKSCRFLGRAEVALADTLAMLSGVPAGTAVWLPLMRRNAGDAVRWAKEERVGRWGACSPQGVLLLLHF